MNQADDSVIRQKFETRGKLLNSDLERDQIGFYTNARTFEQYRHFVAGWRASEQYRESIRLRPRS